MKHYPNILTIAGTDPGGGAGIQADLKTITVLKGFGLSVITALVAQNGMGVKAFLPTPPDFVQQQLEAVYEGFKVHAAKTGMLTNKAIMHELASSLRERDFPLVVDPVCVSQSGHKLIEDDSIEALRSVILPLADLITPNQPEAQELSGVSIKTPDDVRVAGRKLLDMGTGAVLLKGGHFAPGEGGSTESLMLDWLFTPDCELALPHRRVHTGNNHGTGCTLSAAIATFLGFGFPLEEAVRNAQEFLLKALEGSFNPGNGAGPVNFMAGAGLA